VQVLILIEYGSVNLSQCGSSIHYHIKLRIPTKGDEMRSKKKMNDQIRWRHFSIF